MPAAACKDKEQQSRGSIIVNTETQSHSEPRKQKGPREGVQGGVIKASREKLQLSLFSRKSMKFVGEGS